VGWTHEHQTLIDSLQRWCGIVSRSFIDLGIGPSDSLGTKLSAMPFIMFFLLLSTYSVYFLIRHTPPRQWVFVVTLIASVALPLFLMDIALGRRYGTTRFILSSSIGIQLAVAYVLSMQISNLAARPWRRRSWQAVAGTLILVGVVSCVVRSQRDTWWNKVPSKYGEYPQIARILNQASQPVMYSYGGWSKTQVICHRLDDKVRLQLLDDDQVPELSTDLHDVFLFNPTDADRSNIEQSYDVEVQRIRGALWKLAQRQ
jgi:uncharacterized membrane protein